MRINKTQAGNIAAQLLTAKAVEIKELKRQLSELATEIHVNNIPLAVRELFAFNPHYFTQTSRLKVFDNGFSGEEIILTKYVPSKNDSFTASININETLAKPLRALFDRVESKESEYKNLCKDLENAIYNLRTPAKLVEAFPEAANWVEIDKKPDAVAISIQTLRERLK